MPWCEQCDRELEDEELAEDGHCPACGSEPLPHRKSPWWFKFLAVAMLRASAPLATSVVRDFLRM